MRFLALGDSYTIGEGVAQSERWPVQLVSMLARRGVKLAAPEIIARTGWTTAELAAGIQRARPKGPYDLVSLLIGVNNQYRGRDEDEYRREFSSLLEQAIALARGKPDRVVVLSIPDWGVTPYATGRDRAAIGTAIDRFNIINRDETLRRHARYVDVTSISRVAERDSTLLAADGLHPAGRMYASWAERVLPEALAALGRAGR